MEGALFLFREKRKRKSFWISEDADFFLVIKSEKRNRRTEREAVEKR